MLFCQLQWVLAVQARRLMLQPPEALSLGALELQRLQVAAAAKSMPSCQLQWVLASLQELQARRLILQRPEALSLGALNCSACRLLRQQVHAVLPAAVGTCITPGGAPDPSASGGVISGSTGVAAPAGCCGSSFMLSCQLQWVLASLQAGRLILQPPEALSLGALELQRLQVAATVNLCRPASCSGYLHHSRRGA